jgi:hypothetical protein
MPLAVTKFLYKNKSSVDQEAIFYMLYKYNFFQISLEKFKDACELLCTHLTEHGTIEQLMELYKMMHINKDSLFSDTAI